MATYLQGITDFIPQLQRFKPDMGSIDYFLRTKEAQYQQGYSKLSGIYGSLLNAPILNNQTRERRDQYFKDIQDQIQKISEVDLSLNDNVQTAMQVFQPLIDDPYVGSGIGKTKKYFNETSRAESLRTSTDPKIQTQYWNEGVQDVTNWAQDYSQAPMEDAVRYDDPKYVPSYDIKSEVHNFLKDSGIKMTRVTFRGGYIWKTTNGNEIVPSMYEFMEGTLGQDPRFKEMMGVKARLNRRSWIDNSLMEFNGDRVAAEDAYDAQVMSGLTQRQGQRTRTLNGKSKEVDDKITLTSKNIEEAGGIKSDNPLVQTLRDLQAQKKVLDNAQVYNADISSNIDPSSLLSAERQAKRKRIDNAVGANMLSGHLLELTNAYANLTMEEDVTADPFAVAALKHQYDIQMEGIKQQGRVQLALAKKQIKEVEYKKFLPVTNDDILAGSGADVDEIAQDEANRKLERTQLQSAQTSVMNHLYDGLIQRANDQGQDPAQRADAKKQLEYLFPKEALAQAGNKVGGLASSKYFNDYGYMWYPGVVKKIDSNWMRQNYGDILRDVSADVSRSGIQNQLKVADFHGEHTRKQNLNLLKWASSSLPDRKDYNTLESIIDLSGNILPREQYKGKDYDQAVQKYTQIVNSSPSMPDGTPVWRSWEGGLSGGRAAGSMRRSVHPGDFGDAPLVLKQLNNVVNGDKTQGYTIGIPTSETKVDTDPSTDIVLKTYLQEFDNESRTEKGKKTTMGEVIVHPIAANNAGMVAVTVKPSHSWLVDHQNKKDKGVTDWNKYEAGITTLMKKEDAPGFFNNFKRGPVAQLVDNGHPVTINQFKNAGTLTIQKDPKGGYITMWDHKGFDRDGRPTRQNEKYYYNDVDPDQIYNTALEKLPLIDQQNTYLGKLSPEVKGPIYTAGDAAQTEDQTDEE